MSYTKNRVGWEPRVATRSDAGFYCRRVRSGFF